MTASLVFTPSDFVAIFNQTLEFAYPNVVIEGEVASFRIAKNRWVYFDIKDNEAVLRCFAVVHMLPGTIEDGMMVRVTASPRLHPQYNFSLTVDTIVPIGEGAIAKQAELTYKKLEAEGLFELSRKRPLPFAPRRVAFISGDASAAYSDFVKIADERWPAMEIHFYPSSVQGDQAPLELIERIAKINQSSEPYDVLVIARGGGSAEDLIAFQDERVVRAIAASRIPTLVAIGHEVDNSLAEYVADMRASTPSNAAELLTPDRKEELALLDATLSMLDATQKRIFIDERTELRALSDAFVVSLERMFDNEHLWLTHQRATIEVLSPSAILKRGYALVRKHETLVTSTKKVAKGDKLAVTLSDGYIEVEVL